LDVYFILINNKGNPWMTPKFRLLLTLLILFGFILQACTSQAPQSVSTLLPGSATEEPAVSETTLTTLSPTESQLESTGPATKITVVLLPYLTYAPLFIAGEEGYFAEQNLEVEYVKLFGQDSFVALASSKLDVGATLFNVAVFRAIGEGGQIKIVSDKGYVDPGGCATYGLLVRKALLDSGEVKEAIDLKGRKGAFDTASVQSYFLDTVLNGAGLSLSDVSQTDFESPANELEAYASGGVDFSVQTEPWLTRITETGNAVLWKTFNEVMPNQQFGANFFGPTLFEKNPDAGQRFMRAYLKAVQQYNLGKTDRNIELLAKFSKLDTALLNKVCWPAFRADGSINADSLQKFQEWGVANGMLDQVLTPDQYWDGRFVDEANNS
jgi:NitT/TauT family transport system substrate-binding protein